MFDGKTFLLQQQPDVCAANTTATSHTDKSDAAKTSGVSLFVPATTVKHCIAQNFGGLLPQNKRKCDWAYDNQPCERRKIADFFRLCPIVTYKIFVLTK